MIFGKPGAEKNLETMVRERIDQRDQEDDIERNRRGPQASAPVSVQDNSITTYSTTQAGTEIAPMFGKTQYQVALTV